MSESFETASGGRQSDPVFGPLLDTERLERTVTPRDIETAGGMTAIEVAELISAFGLPAPEADDPWFTPSEASTIAALSRLREIWPRDVYLQAARVYGHALSEIAENEVHLFRYDVEQKLRAESGDPAEALPRVRSAFEQLLPLADPMMVAIHRRWLEHQLAQAAVGDAELRSPGSPLPGAQEVSFLFCDLKDFTAYADTNGDAAAIEAIDHFSEIVHGEQGGGRVVKGIGDAYMLVYPRPEPAVAAGARIVVRMHGAGPPFVHASVHSGIAIYREGDYFGRAVNLAARLFGVSGNDELVATTSVVEACREQNWQHRGAIKVRGMSAPVDVYRLVGTDS